MEASVEQRSFLELYSELLGLDLVLGENEIQCFAHEEENASCHVNTLNGLWHCKACPARGGWPEAYAIVKNVQLDTAKKKARELGVSFDRGVAGRKPASRDGKVLVNGEGMLRSYQVKRVSGGGWLGESLGWRGDVVERLGLGVKVGGSPDSRAVVYPVRNTHGELVNLRYYYPWHELPKPKVCGVDGHNSAYLWPVEALLDDAVDSVVVCEGEKDVVTLTHHLPDGWVAVTGTGGSGTWNPALNDLFEGKRVVVAYDCDDAGRKGAARVARELVEYAAEIRTVDLGGSDGFDVHDYFQQHEWADFQALIDGSGSVRPLHTVARLDGWLADCVDDKGKVHPVLVGEKFLREYPLRVKGGLVYRYDHDQGVYRPDGEEFIVRQLLAVLGQAWRKTLKTEIQTYLLDATGLDPFDPPSKDLVNCENGLLNVVTRHLADHTPEFLSPTQIPVRYDANAKCPAVEQFLKNALQPGDDQVFYEIAGLLLVPNNDLHRMFMLVGSGANGKSTALKLLVALIGEENRSVVSPHELEDDRFAAASLFGKLANVCADIESRDLTKTATLKKIVGGDAIYAQHKNKKPFEFTPYSRLLFSANRPPITSDATLGFYRRFLIIPFENRFDKPDRDIDRKLQEPSELSGLLNHALDGLDRLRANGEFTRTPTTTRAMEDFRSDTSIIGMFCREHIQVESGAELRRTLAWEKFQEWTDATRHGKGMGRNTFYGNLAQQFPDARLGKHADNKEYYFGIKYVDGPVEELVVDDDIPF